MGSKKEFRMESVPTTGVGDCEGVKSSLRKIALFEKVSFNKMTSQSVWKSDD